MTLQKLEQAITAIYDVLKTVDGIRQAHELPPDDPNAWPALVIFPQGGTYEASPIGSRKGLHNIIIDVLIPQQQSTLPRQMAVLIPLIDLVPAALLAQVSDNGGQFTNTISTFEGVSYSFISENYAAVPCRGYRFTMRNVKILE